MHAASAMHERKSDRQSCAMQASHGSLPASHCVPPCPQGGTHTPSTQDVEQQLLPGLEQMAQSDVHSASLRDDASLGGAAPDSTVGGGVASVWRVGPVVAESAEELGEASPSPASVSDADAVRPAHATTNAKGTICPMRRPG